MLRDSILTKILSGLIILIVGVGIGLSFKACDGSPDEPEVIYKEVHDTTTIIKDTIIWKTKLDSVIVRDTFYLNKEGDTVILNDLPIEYKEYSDTIKKDSSETEIKIKYHGFAAEIDQIDLYHSYYNKIEIQKPKPKKFGIDITIGPAVGWGWYLGGPTYGGPTVGIDIVIGPSWRITK